MEQTKEQSTLPDLSATFLKSERLCRKKIIDDLFSLKQSFLVFPYRIVWMSFEPIETSAIQIAIGVGKKYDKRAVKRNLIKRRIREAYRKNKHPLYQYCEKNKKGFYIFISFVGKEELSYTYLEERLKKVFDKLIHIHEENNNMATDSSR